MLTGPQLENSHWNPWTSVQDWETTTGWRRDQESNHGFIGVRVNLRPLYKTLLLLTHG